MGLSGMSWVTGWPSDSFWQYAAIRECSSFLGTGGHTGHRIQGTEYRIQGTEYRRQNTEYRVQNTENIFQNTIYRIQNTEYRIQYTEYLIQNSIKKKHVGKESLQERGGC